jgi:hypothetical protein
MPVSRRSLLGAAALGFLTGPFSLRWARAIDQALQPAVPNAPVVPQPAAPVNPAPVDHSKDMRPRLWNRSDVPFVFQFSRRRGVTWSKAFTLAPGEFIHLDDSVPGYEELEYLHLYDGQAVIQYRDYCGLMAHKLKVPPQEFQLNRDGLLEGRLPYVFVVRDVEGHVHLQVAQPLKVGELSQAFNETIAALDRIVADLNHSSPKIRYDMLAQLVGPDNVDVPVRIRNLIANHILTCAQPGPNAGGPCPRPECGATLPLFPR